MAKTAKSSSKTASKKAGTKKESKGSSSKKTHGGTFLKSLPESMEHIQIVQQVAGVLEELQNRVIDVKEEASKELKKLMKRYETNYRGLEKKVHQVTLEAKKQAQTSMIQILQKWHEHKEKLPKPLAKEIEKIIQQIGTRVVTKKAAAPKKTTATKTSRALPKTAKTKAATSKKKAAASKAKTTKKGSRSQAAAATTEPEKRPPLV